MSEHPVANATESLHPTIAALEASGADRFNPVRFRHIKTMASRCLEQDGAVADIVVKKALAALTLYQSELRRERAEAEALVEQLASQYPDSANQILALLQACDFKAVKRMAARLQRPPPTGELISLVHRLNEGARPSAEGLEPGSIGELLRTQENDAVKFFATTARANTLPAQTTGELKSTRYFRVVLQQQRVNQLVTRAVAEAPEGAGPLNPQKLAIRSLAAMRDLSPAYLGRFVSYVDTLFWLEKADKNNKT